MDRSLARAVAILAAACLGAAPASAVSPPAKEGPSDPYAGLRLYAGDIHVHTGLAIYMVLEPDNPHTIGTPDEVLDVAQSRGLDFVVITDHTNNMNDPRGVEWREETGNLFTLPDGRKTASEWENLQATIARRNQPGRFVVFLGLEYTRGNTETTAPGHKAAAFPASTLPRYCSNFPHNVGDCPTGQDFLDFAAEQGGVVTVAHPCADWGPSDWTEFSGVVTGVEILAGKCEFGPNGYNDALGRLRHKIGARGSSDSHHFEVGSNDKTMCFAKELTREAILDSMRANLCYYVDEFPVDLRFDINGVPMGSTITDAGGGLSIHARAHSDWQTEFDHMDLIHDGKKILETVCEDAEYDDCEMTSYLPSDTAGYYYVGLSNASGRRLAISSPIWVEPGN